jgi:ubiquitin C-terminal hydrolase
MERSLNTLVIINFNTGQCNQQSVTPKGVIQNIKLIAKNLRIGRQEDAHEFLLYLLDAMEKSSKQFKLTSTKGFIKSNESQSDNLIQKIFGGKMISSVTCLKCKKSSKKIDNYLDLSLVIFNFNFRKFPMLKI